MNSHLLPEVIEVAIYFRQKWHLMRYEQSRNTSNQSIHKMSSSMPTTYIELTAYPDGDNSIEGNYLTVDKGKVELYFQIYDEHGNYVSLVLREVGANHLALLADVVNGAQCELFEQEQEEQEAQPPK